MYCGTPCIFFFFSFFLQMQFITRSNPQSGVANLLRFMWFVKSDVILLLGEGKIFFFFSTRTEPEGPNCSDDRSGEEDDSRFSWFFFFLIYLFIYWLYTRGRSQIFCVFLMISDVYKPPRQVETPNTGVDRYEITHNWLLATNGCPFPPQAHFLHCVLPPQITWNKMYPHPSFTSPFFTSQHCVLLILGVS